MKKKYYKMTKKKRSSLFLKAKFFIKCFEEGHEFFDKKFVSPIRGTHKLKELDYSLIGQINFQTESWNVSNNGEIVDVILLASNEHKKIIENDISWEVNTGIEYFGTLELVEMIGFDE